MSEVFVTSDLHLNHANIIWYCNRPFGSVEEMNRAITDNWNNAVQPADTVYILGDFAMGDRSKIPALLARLNGYKILVLGNHDNKKDYQHFDNVTPLRWGHIHQSVTFTMQHHPLRDGDIVPEPWDVLPPPVGAPHVALCGHIHGAWRSKAITLADGRTIQQHNVGVDVRGFTPRRLESFCDEASV